MHVWRARWGLARGRAAIVTALTPWPPNQGRSESEAEAAGVAAILRWRRASARQAVLETSGKLSGSPSVPRCRIVWVSCDGRRWTVACR